MKKAFFSMAIMLLCSAASVQATLVLDQQQLNQNTTSYIGVESFQRNGVVHSFTAIITGTLKQIDVLCTEGQSGSTVLGVYEGLSVTALVDQSDVTPLQDGWLSFYFDAPVTAGQVYTLCVWEDENIKGLRTFGYLGDDAIGYEHIVASGTVLPSSNNAFPVFKSWVEPIPEPATLLLLTLGGCFLRRRK